MELSTLIAFLIVFAAALYFWHRVVIIEQRERERRAKQHYNQHRKALRERINLLEESIQILSTRTATDKDEKKTLPTAKNPAISMEDRIEQELSKVVTVNGLPVRK